MTEVVLEIEDRVILIDIDPNDLKTLKVEFEEVCADDEALSRRRKSYSPTFSVWNETLSMNCEVKRKHKFQTGDRVYIGWSPLQLEVAERCESGLKTPLKDIRNIRTDHEATSKKTPGKAKGKENGPTEEQHIYAQVLKRHGMEPSTGAMKQTSKKDESGPSSSTAGNYSGIHSDDTMILSDQPYDESSDSHDDEWYGEVIEYFPGNSWQMLSKYDKRRHKSCYELHEEKLKQGLVHGPYSPSLGTIYQPKPKQKNKSRSVAVQKKTKSPQNTDQRMSLRKRKPVGQVESSSKAGSCRRRIVEAENSDCDSPDTDNNLDADGDESMYIDEDETEDYADDEVETQDDADNEVETDEEAPKKRRKCYKPTRGYGKALVGSKLKVNFGDSALASLEKGEPNMTFVLGDIRAHIKNKTNHDYIYPDELQNLCIQLIQDYPVLSDAGDPDGYKRLRDSIDASIRGARNYTNNTKPRREKRKRRPQNNADVADDQETPAEIFNAQLMAVKSLNATTNIKFLISKSFEVRVLEFEVAHNLRDVIRQIEECKAVWLRYPHYRDGRMLIYEHCISMHIDMETLIDNYNHALGTLQEKLSWPVKTHLEQLEAMLKVYQEVTPRTLKGGNITPVIKIVDVSEAEGADAVRTTQAGHSPCVLVSTDINEMGQVTLKNCYLKLYSISLGTIPDPTASEVVLLLLAGYFIGRIQYPDAYKSFIRYLETSIHGGLCPHTRAQRIHATFNKFMKRIA